MELNQRKTLDKLGSLCAGPLSLTEDKAAFYANLPLRSLRCVFTEEKHNYNDIILKMSPDYLPPATQKYLLSLRVKAIMASDRLFTVK